MKTVTSLQRVEGYRPRYSRLSPRVLLADASVVALTTCFACGAAAPTTPNQAQTTGATGATGSTGANTSTISGMDASVNTTGKPSGGTQDAASSALVDAPPTNVPRDAPFMGPADPCIAAGTCPPGTWVDVTPSTVSLSLTASNGNYGVQDVIVDPANPNVLYAFICLQGVWKSTDYGLTWAKIDTGTNSNHLDLGRPWTAAIDPNPNRNPSTPPTLYTVGAEGDLLGVYKSTDGGVNWTVYSVGNTTVIAAAGSPGIGDDVYSLDIDPYNSVHIIAGFHGYPGISESKNGGQTWTTIPVPSGIGDSLYGFFINTGVASTTATTWLTLSGAGDTDDGMWRTANEGTSWTQVQSTLQHAHGASQIYQDGHGGIYAAGLGSTNGVWRSTDYAQTWAPANTGGLVQNAVFASATFLYAMTFEGSVDIDPNAVHLQRSPATDGVNWSDWTPVSPTGMTNGVKRVAVTYDGAHYIFVSGNWDAGLFRYVEPTGG